MKNFFSKLLYKFQRFMYGRYGFDRLLTVLFIGYFILVLAANAFYRFSRVSYYALMVLALALFVFGIYRVFSKNIEARRSEYESWLRFSGKFKQSFRLGKSKWKQRKTHKFVRCSKCKKTLRLPKNRGKINVICPHCKNQFIVNTGRKK